MRSNIAFAVLAAGLFIPMELAAQTHDHASHADPAPSRSVGAAPLVEAGNGAFAAVQEVVRLLESRPDTDWETVDLEALRRHLVDMDNMTLRAVVLSQEDVPGGVRLVVRGEDPAADASIRRALVAHAAMIAREREWTMEVEPGENGHSVVVTSPRAEDAAKIRGLGYIGIMALGGHHAPHHLMIATGQAPHGH